MMLILSPSILAADFTILGEQMSKVEEGGCDYFHFDVMDGMFVPNISFGIPVLASVRKFTKKTLDVHLMVQEPERYIDKFIDSGADIVTVHKEATDDALSALRAIRRRGKRAGLAIKPYTDTKELIPFFGEADMFLIMTVEPGFGGQKYMDICTDKIKALRGSLREAGLDTDIQVDGGITRDNINTVIDAGANVIVMGSSVFSGDIKGNAAYFTELFRTYNKGEIQ
ncbi:MAG: ribulose-phosphate 3-epimerase [Lachnospiraceae bacterium]|nr:ribulose-phosphate 3-epimerase [Lachnospiraceae bacterium]